MGLGRLRFFFLLFVLVDYAPESWAQYCLSQYQTAQSSYEDGRIDAVLDDLDSCLAHPKLARKLSKSTRVELYKLAANAHILLDEPGDALDNIYRVLAERPFYDSRNYPDDLLMFSAAVDTLRADPQWIVGFRGGINTTLVKTEKSFSVLEFDEQVPSRRYAENLLDQEASELKRILGFQFSFLIEYVIWSKHLSVSVEPGFSNLRYEYQIAYPELNNSFAATQKISYFDLPFLLKYRLFLKKTFQPYAQVGLSNRFLVSANKEIISQFRPSSTSSTVITRKTPETPVNSLMHNYIYGLIFGLGVNWDWKIVDNTFLRNSSLSLDLRYFSALENANDPGKRFVNNDLSDVFLFEFYDVTDDIKLRNWEVSLILRHNLRYKVFKR